MADFEPAFERMIRNEGGYVLHEVAGDRGGQTFAGIARKFHPSWQGWDIIDQNPDDPQNPQLTEFVRDFYKIHFWDRIKGDDIESQAIASTIFDFSVNAGIRIGSKLAQIVVGATADGIIGDKTVAVINQAEPDLFQAHYALAKVKRYSDIVTRNPSQKKFLLGWINRTLGDLA